MEKTRNLCAQIPESLHQRVREEQEAAQKTLSQYVEMILREHFEGGTTMSGSTRTLAVQISEELFQRLKAHLAKHPKLSQKEFVVGLIERALADAEAEAEEDRP